ncbi:MAG: adenylate kinase [Acidobacteria bacterium]|nr:adenylate kinase [Acidobacteriota bacterium]
MTECSILVLLGAPGAGKGTQAKKLAREFEMNHLSTGDALRKKAREDTPLGNQARQSMERGELVSDELVAQVVWECMTGSSELTGFILDGFPRNLAQAELLEEIAGKTPIWVINIRVDEEVVIKRLSGRRQCMDCGRISNVNFSPPRQEGVCDACGAKLVQRPDDLPDVIQRRLQVYREQTKPLTDFYSKKGCYFEVDGNQDTDTVFKRISAHLTGGESSAGNSHLSAGQASA